MRDAIVPLTPDILEQAYGEQKPPYSMRGYAVMIEGKPELVFGLAHFDGHHVLFSRTSPELRARRGAIATRRVVIQVINQVRELVQRMRGPVRALADPDLEGSCELLERIGFVPLRGRVYQWPWQSQ